MRVMITDVLPSIDLTRSGSFDKSLKPLHALEAHRKVAVAAVAPLASRAALTSRESARGQAGAAGYEGAGGPFWNESGTVLRMTGLSAARVHSMFAVTAARIDAAGRRPPENHSVMISLPATRQGN